MLVCFQLDLLETASGHHGEGGSVWGGDRLQAVPGEAASCTELLSAGWSWFCPPPGVLEEVGGNVFPLNLLPCSRLCPKAWSPVSVGHESGWDSGSLRRPHAPRGSRARLRLLTHSHVGGTQGLVAVRLRPPLPVRGHPPGRIFTRTVWRLALPDRCRAGSRAHVLVTEELPRFCHAHVTRSKPVSPVHAAGEGCRG